MLVLAFGILVGCGIILGGKVGMDATSTDKFCDQACHVHPEATQTWIKSTHFTTKSGVVTHCIECHLPAGGLEYYTEKARLGAQDIYGKLFKDVSKIDWQSKRSYERGLTFTYDSACIRCHANLFSKGLSRKGVDGHLHYQRSQGKMKCIRCHMQVGHYRGRPAEELQDEEVVAERELDKAFPLGPEGFQNYTDVIPGSDVKFRMAAIPGGEFELGSPDSEPYRRPDEGPIRKVRVGPFWMGRAEVSWREYEVYYAQRGIPRAERVTNADVDAQTGPTPPYGSPDQGWGRGSRPAITVTYHAAMKYCEWLSEVTGKKYRLPTEAEWEYACRAGTSGPYFFPGNPSRFTARSLLNRIIGVKTEPVSEYAWYLSNSNERTHPPHTVKPNPWGLVNILGNVKEFCLDWYEPDAYAQYPVGEVIVDPRGPATGKEHVIRGGSFRTDGADLRAAARDRTRHDDWLMTDPQSPKSIWWYSDCTDVGFRIVREYEETAPTRKSAQARLKPAKR